MYNVGDVVTVKLENGSYLKAKIACRAQGKTSILYLVGDFWYMEEDFIQKDTMHKFHVGDAVLVRTNSETIEKSVLLGIVEQVHVVEPKTEISYNYFIKFSTDMRPYYPLDRFPENKIIKAPEGW